MRQLLSLLLNNRKDRFFRAGISACIYNAAGEFLLFRRTDVPRTNNEKPEISNAWQFPQGGREQGESVHETLWRELYEETGLKREDFISYQTLPFYISYEYSKQWSEKVEKLPWIGQTHTWYFLELRDGIEIDLTKTSDKEFNDYQWMNADQVLDHVVDFRKPGYKQVFQYFEQHIKK